MSYIHTCADESCCEVYRKDYYLGCRLPYFRDAETSIGNYCMCEGDCEDDCNDSCVDCVFAKMIRMMPESLFELLSTRLNAYFANQDEDLLVISISEPNVAFTPEEEELLFKSLGEFKRIIKASELACDSHTKRILTDLTSSIYNLIC